GARMKRAVSIAALALVGLSAAPAEAQRHGGQTRAALSEAPEEIALAVGETKTIPAKNVKSYSEGAAGIVGVTFSADGQSFIINGKKPGSSTLLLIYDNGTQRTINFTVSTQSPAIVEKELTQLLDGIDGVHVRRVGAHIVIDGRVST